MVHMTASIQSKGKSLGISYINGMLGRQVYNVVVTKSKKEVHLTVYDRLYSNPSHDSIHILQTYMQDMDLANVLMDQVPRYRKIVVQFRAPLSEQQVLHLQGATRARAPIRFPLDYVRKPSKRKRSFSSASPHRRVGNSSSYRPLIPFDEGEFVDDLALTDSPASPDASPIHPDSPTEDQGDGLPL